jgi:hypothetical protein
MANKSMREIWGDKRKESERLSKIHSKNKQDDTQVNIKPQKAEKESSKTNNQ